MTVLLAQDRAPAGLIQLDALGDAAADAWIAAYADEVASGSTATGGDEVSSGCAGCEAAVWMEES